MEESKEGVLVSRLVEDGPAEKAGIKPDDIILGLNGTEINSIVDLRIELLDKKPGEQVAVKVLRRGLLFGEERKVMNLELGQ